MQGGTGWNFNSLLGAASAAAKTLAIPAASTVVAPSVLIALNFIPLPQVE
jgi:hypothetical protein